MLKKRKPTMVMSIVGVALLALSACLVGCNGSDSEDVVVRIDKKVTAPAPIAPPTNVAIPSPPVSVIAEPEIAVIPEPPREVTYQDAETAFLDRDYEEAVELFTAYTERKTENPWGYYMLGLSAWKSNELDKAEDAFNQALALDPNHVKSHVNLARVLLDDSRPGEALSTIDGALALDPELGVAYRLRGRAQHQLADTDAAIESYRRAIHLDGNDAWAMNNLGLLLIEQGRFEDALSPLARAIEVRTDIAMFHNNLGMALECTGRYRAAEIAYEQAVALNGTHEKAIINLERIELVAEDAAVSQVDLIELARVFAEEISVASKEDVVGDTTTNDIAIADAAIDGTDRNSIPDVDIEASTESSDSTTLDW